MFEITTNLRVFSVETPSYGRALGVANWLLVPGEAVETITDIGPCPYLIVEIKA